MIELELSQVMRDFVEDHVQLTPDAEVVVLTDAEAVTIAKSLTIAARGTGADVVLQIMPKTKNQNAEPPASVAAALKAADYGFYVTTHSITHTDAFREAQESGTIMKGMRSATADKFMEGAITADFEEIEEINTTVKQCLTNGSTVRVTTDNGTDIRFDISERPAFALGYLSHDLNEDNIGTFPDSGEVAIAPLEASPSGTIVIDHSMDNIGHLESPITLEYVDGKLVEIQGGPEADQLQNIIDNGDQNADTLGEFAIGTNPEARLTANVGEAKDRLGTVHFAVGDNKTLAGNRGSDVHLDGVVLNPTITVDGETIMDAGKLLLH